VTGALFGLFFPCDQTISEHFKTLDEKINKIGSKAVRIGLRGTRADGGEGGGERCGDCPRSARACLRAERSRVDGQVWVRQCLAPVHEPRGMRHYHRTSCPPTVIGFRFGTSNCSALGERLESLVRQKEDAVESLQLSALFSVFNKGDLSNVDPLLTDDSRMVEVCRPRANAPHSTQCRRL